MLCPRGGALLVALATGAASALADPVFVFQKSPGSLLGRSSVFQGASQYWREDFESPALDEPGAGVTTPGAALHGHWLCWASCIDSDADRVQYFGLDSPQSFSRVAIGDGGNHGATSVAIMMNFSSLGMAYTGMVLTVDAEALGGAPNAVSLRLVERGFKDAASSYIVTALDANGAVLGQVDVNYPLDGFEPRTLSVYSPERNIAFLQVMYYGYGENSGFIVDDLEYALDAAAVLVGDANLDGAVDLQDLGALQSNFGGRGDWAAGDFNGDDHVDLSDFVMLKDGRRAAATVPEPSAIALLSAAVLVSLAGSRTASRRGRSLS